MLAGLSTPGPVIKELPLPQLRILVTSALAQIRKPLAKGNTKELSDLLFTDTPLGTSSTSITPGKVRELINNPVIFKKCQEALALPGVEKEIATLPELLTSTDLINETFVKDRLHGEILRSPFRVVHIASHGVFESSSDQSFIMTYDQLLTIDQLESLLQSEKFGDAPIELLTLSACQTAEGDDRHRLALAESHLEPKYAVCSDRCGRCLMKPRCS